jgi:CheY-like chemotaxis protein
LAYLMGGDVLLMRSELGKGSSFRIKIPIVPVSGTTMIRQMAEIDTKVVYPSKDAPISLSGHVLLAEDGIDNQRLIAFHLRKAGATVGVAENGRIALEMLEQAEAIGKPYSILLTDVQMPEMDGYTLSRTLRQQGNHIPIIALTAHAMSDDRQRCIDAGCDDFQSKPIDRLQLLATCAKWLGTITPAKQGEEGN